MRVWTPPISPKGPIHASPAARSRFRDCAYLGICQAFDDDRRFVFLFVTLHLVISFGFLYWLNWLLPRPPAPKFRRRS